MKRIINFSGGKTSAYMTITEYQEGDLVIFCDTGREHHKTYKFIDDFEKHENIPVIRLKFHDAEDPFRELLNHTNNKQIPNNFKRFCTKDLKIRTARRYLRTLGIFNYENFIGFRADEPLRVKRRKQHWKKVIDRFPLYDKGVTKEMINAYWDKKPYNLEIPSILGNCTLCFMKGKNAIISILMSYPELAKEWIEDEKRNVNGYKYFDDLSMQQMLNLAQNNLFKDIKLDDIKPAFDCACTS